MSKTSQLDSDRQIIERLGDVVPPPTFAQTAQVGEPDVTAPLDNKVGWRSAYGAPNDGTPVLVYRGDHAAPLRRYGVDWRSPAKYQGKWACSRPDEQPLFYQELHPPIKAAPVVKRTTHG